MSDDVHRITLELRRPRGNDPGKVLIGHYMVVENAVIITDENGKPVGAEKHRLDPAIDRVSDVASAAERECVKRELQPPDTIPKNWLLASSAGAAHIACRNGEVERESGAPSPLFNSVLRRAISSLAKQRLAGTCRSRPPACKGRALAGCTPGAASTKDRLSPQCQRARWIATRRAAG